MENESSAEVNDITPSSLNHIVGQQHAVEQIRVALDASQMDGHAFPHTLLVGPPGLGKTQLASIIAKEMAAPCIEMLGQSLKTTGDLNALLLSLPSTDKAIVLIDEAHLLKNEIQTALYLAIDRRVIILGNKSGRSPQRLPIFECSFVLATTDEYLLLQPLRDRCKLTLKMQFYSDEELSQLIAIRAKALRWELDPSVVPEIGKRSKGTPRIALRLLGSCRRVCRSLGENEIIQDHLFKACDLEQIDDLGLNQNEQRYLEIVADGDSRLNVIASRLGLPTQTVSQVVEPFLIRAELIVKDDQGRRQLSAIGRSHLNDSDSKM